MFGVLIAILIVTLLPVAGVASPAISSAHLTRNKVMLEPTSPTDNDVFGVSTALTAQQAIIGAPWNSSKINNGGMVYIYERQSMAASDDVINPVANWEQHAVIAPPTLQAKAMFGSSLAVAGNLLLVGAPGEKVTKDGTPLISVGAVHIYTREVSRKPWIYTTTLTAPDQHAGDYFGASIAITGSDLFIGAHLQDNAGIDSGAVYHFKRAGENGGFEYQQKLQPKNLKAGALFGNSLAADGDTLAIGAYGYDGHSPGGGTVYMYQKNGETWQLADQLQAVKRKAFAEFGWSLALKGKRLVVGAPYEDEKNASPGAAYVFERGNDTNNPWQPVARLRYTDERWEQRFGASVALTENAVVVGAPYGVAYVFKIPAPTKPSADTLASWPQLGKLVGTTPYSENLFSGTIALHGHDILLGVPSQVKTNSGAAYIFPDALAPQKAVEHLQRKSE